MDISQLTVPLREKEDFFHQLDDFYSAPFPSCAAQEAELRALTADPALDCFQKRELSYRFLAEKLEIAVFSKCPFALHYNNRLSRADVEMSGISYWYSNSEPAQQVRDEFFRNTADNTANGLAIYYLPVDNGHLTLDYETVLQKGINGILCEAEGFAQNAPPEKHTFYAAAISGLNAYKRLAERFSALAAEKACAAEGEDQVRLLTLSRSIGRVPAQPAQSFTEALTAIVFLYFTVPALDGGNVSVFGHVDRLLSPYLEKDLKAGAITYAQAFDLLWRFLYIPDSRWGKNHMGTNATITLGGCDRNGKAVFNDVTKMILTAYRQLRCIDPKLNIRMTADASPEFLSLSAEAIRDGLNNVCIFNDSVIIPANHKAGKALEDCRLYVGGGCQENVLAACEMNSRATIYMNALPALLCGWKDSSWDSFLNRFCPEKPLFFAPDDDFEQLYRKTLHNLRVHITAQVNMKNHTEAKGLRWCASPAHSALLQNCLEKGADMFAGGSKYASGSVSLTGIGTLIDSLLAIKWVVFEQKLMPLAAFITIVKDNFCGNEALRQQIITHAPKYTCCAAANVFAARLLRDAAAAVKGLKNTRGGSYEASLFSFRSYTYLGTRLGATPDGRLAGEYLSAGMSPTLLAHTQATEILSALKELDLTDYPVVAVLDLKLPSTSQQVMTALILQFLRYGGSVLQINIADQPTLLEAKAHPERHPDLVVRMSGFSARFAALSDTEKDEVIERTVN